MHNHKMFHYSLCLLVCYHAATAMVTHIENKHMVAWKRMKERKKEKNID